MENKKYLWFKRYTLPIFLHNPKWHLQGTVYINAETMSAWQLQLTYNFNELAWVSKDKFNKLELIESIKVK